MPDGRAVSGEVDDRDVRMFLVVAQEMHFGRGAARLGVTGSRVSQVVARLERRVGGSLFERNSRSVVLSPLGHLLRDLAAPAVAALDQAVCKTRQAATGLPAPLVVGSYHPVVMSEPVARLLNAFEADAPGAQISLRECAHGTELFDLLRRGDIDVMVMRQPVHDLDITVGPVVAREPRVALLSRDHPLAGQTELTWEQIADYPVTDLPHFPRSVVDALAPPRTRSGRLLRRKYADSFADIVRYAVAGELIHPTVPSAVCRLVHPQLVARPIVDLPESTSALMWLSRRDGDPAISALAEIAAHVI